MACSLPTAYTRLGYILGIPPRGCGDFLKENNDEHADVASSVEMGILGKGRDRGSSRGLLWEGYGTHNM